MTLRHRSPTECQQHDEPELEPTATREPDEDERIASILDEYIIELEEGRELSPDALCERYPELADKLRVYLSGINIVKNFAEAHNPLPSDSSVSTPSRWDASCSRAPTDLSSSGTRGFKSTVSHSLGSSRNRSQGKSRNELIVRSDERPNEDPPRRLGDYVLGPVIGQGAMGVVYKAYDSRRGESVAIKVLTDHGTLDPSRIDRFRREAKTAASLEHPNLVPVHSVGCCQGTHYYAMQFIDGESLDRRITSTRLLGELGADIRRSDRNALVRSAAPLVGADRYCRIAQMGASAASALHAAHIAGVIHRDIKPSNLVLGYDGQLWLTDFGLARVLSEAGLTRTGELVGTIRYMSPEQANGQGDLIDARTDVYALGVTLYELATLTQAFSGDDPMQVLRAIRSTEPIPPRALDSNIPNDLGVIISRAMRPRPADRYPTAAAMATDLQRFVAGKPILANSVTWTERGISLVRKHRQLAFGLMVSLGGLLLLSFVASYLIIREQAETLKALRTKERHYYQARRAVDTLGADVAKRLANVPGAASIRLDVLDTTLRYYKQFIDDSANDPQLQRDVALSKLEIARLTALSASPADADAAYRAAELAFLEVIDQSQAVQLDEVRLEYTRLLNEWALLVDRQGYPMAAYPKLEKALHVLAHPVGDSDKTHVHLLRALTYNNMGVIAISSNDERHAKIALRKAIRILQPLAIDQSMSPELASELADAFSNLSAILGNAGHFNEAVRAAEQSLKLRWETISLRNDEQTERVAVTCSNLAALYWNAGKTHQALKSYRRAVTLLEEAVAAAPTQDRPRNRLAITLNNLGMALATAADYEEAEKAFQKAESMAQQAFDATPNDRQAAQRLATIQNNLGLLLQSLGRRDEAEQYLQQANNTWSSEGEARSQLGVEPLTPLTHLQIQDL